MGPLIVISCRKSCVIGLIASKEQHAIHGPVAPSCVARLRPNEVIGTAINSDPYYNGRVSAPWQGTFRKECLQSAASIFINTAYSLAFSIAAESAGKHIIYLPDRFESVQTIIDAVPNPIFAKDRSHQIVLINRSGCAFFGHSRETLLTRSDTELFPAEQIRIFHTADDKVFETGDDSEDEEQVTDAAGCIRHVITRKGIVRLEENEYLVASVTDISAFVRLRRRTATWPSMIH